MKGRFRELSAATRRMRECALASPDGRPCSTCRGRVTELMGDAWLPCDLGGVEVWFSCRFHTPCEREADA